MRGSPASGERKCKHGATGTPEYRAWASMIDRCTHKYAKAYKDYGGRGIVVCRRWQGKNGFVKFLADVGRRPSPQHQLDRKENDGPYSKSNCRWATRSEQAKNRRSTRTIEFSGRKQCLADWAEEIGITPQSLSKRLKKHPLSIALREVVRCFKPA